jgi:lysophospholipase
MTVVHIEELPCPAGGTVGWLQRPDGARLRTMIWPASVAATPARGTVVLASGRTEFIEKYFEVIDHFLKRGFAVATFDWRGQGLSERMLEDPRKGHVDDFATFDADFVAFMDEVVRPNFEGPYVGVGHSMGGNLMLRAAHNLPEAFSAVVLSAPMLGINLGSPFVSWVTRALVSIWSALGGDAMYAPGSGPKAADEEQFEGNVVTSDPVRYRRQQAVIAKAPSIGLGGPTIGWVREAFRSIDEVSSPAYLAAVKTPILLFEASKDKLVKAGSIPQIAEGLPNGECLSVEGAEHEILMEQERHRNFFWTHFDTFVDKHLKA